MSALRQVLPTFGTVNTGQSRPGGGAASAFVEDSRAKAVADAEAQGFDNGMAAAREEYEARLEEVRLDFERQLKEERARWSEQESARLADDLQVALCALESRLANDVAGVLLPLIDKMLAAKAVSEIEEAVHAIVSQERQPFLKVTGREDLLEALRVRLGHVGASFEFIGEEGATGVILAAGDTVIEAQLKSWSERLLRSLGGDGHG